MFGHTNYNVELPSSYLLRQSEYKIALAERMRNGFGHMKGKRSRNAFSSEIHRINVHRVKAFHRSGSLLFVLLFILSFAVWSSLLLRPSQTARLK